MRCAACSIPCAQSPGAGCAALLADAMRPANTCRVRLILAHAFYALLAAAFIWVGVQNARTLWLVVQPDSHFDQRTGAIEEVIKHRDPGYDGVGKPTFVAEVKFSYSVNGARFVSNTLSARCNWCSPKDVFDATGRRPSLLARGTAVKVFVKRDAPAVAYLQLSSTDDVIEQAWFTLLCLVLAPCFLYFHHWAMLRRPGSD
jgi:hypothetical protein